MKVIGFDATAPLLTVGLSENGAAVGRWDAHAERRRGNTLEVLIDRALAEAGWSRSAMDGLSVVTGPGSLTATRIGWATAAGWAQALDIPVAGWPTAAVQRRYWSDKNVRARYAGMEDGDRILSLVHHRGNEFYAYDLTARSDALPQAVRIDGGPVNPPGRVWLAGPGIIGCRERWQALLRGGMQLVDQTDAIVGGDLLAVWGTEDLGAGRSLALDESPLDYGFPPDFRKQKR